MTMPILKRIRWFYGNCEAGLCADPATHSAISTVTGGVTFYCHIHARVALALQSNIMVKSL